MDFHVKNPNVRWLLFAGIVVASCGLFYAATRYGIAGYWAESSSPDLWLRAAALEPSNPNTWYSLGRYREFDLEHGDLPLAISYYQRATAIEPISALYWMDLAGTYELTGNSASAEQAYRTAQQDYPISPEVAWRYGSFLLRQNRIDEAFQQIRQAIAVDPSLTALAVSRCWRSTQDVNRIVDFALPDKPDAYWGAIQFFISAGRPEAAMAAWKKLAAERPSFSLLKSAPLLDFLVQSGNIDDARTVWDQSLSAAGIASSPDPTGSLIGNGGFEQELLNAGFAWRYSPIQGADLNLDEETVHSGARSLRITFDGSANVDFGQIWQYVPVEPSTAYRFSAYVRTQELSTETGIHFEISDATDAEMAAISTPDVVGTQPWVLNDIQFVTGPQTRLLRVVLRRNQSKMLSNKVSGTVWVDDVSLVPASLGKPVTR